jgi:uncharacterized LabA/DUF88 family protein
MLFIDGTNLFYRIESKGLVVPQLSLIFDRFPILGGRQLARIYLYTIQEHLDRAVQRHGDLFLSQIRVVLGHGVPTKDGNVKEKGVDALLVADLVYHAASRNVDYTVLVSTDTDFIHAIRRVEDFGCRTAVVGICADVPARLREHCDAHLMITAEQLEEARLARRT